MKDLDQNLIQETDKLSQRFTKPPLKKFENIERDQKMNKSKKKNQNAKQNNRKQERTIQQVDQLLQDMEKWIQTQAQFKNLLKVKETFCQEVGESLSTIYGYERQLTLMGVQ